VLPFQNLGPAEDAYFADGVTDEITTRLATVEGLQVIGGQSALQYKGTSKPPRQIATEIGVDFVLEGTVSWQRARGAPGRVRVRPRLIDARDERQVWADVLDQDITELFSLLSGIAERVVGELHVVLEASQQQGLAAVPTKDLEAYDYYLRGRAFARGTWSAGTNLSAIQMFERAVARDSTFALAQARLSFSHTEAFWLNQLGPEHLVQAKAAAERALRLDPSLPDAHTALGHYYYACCGDYERALEHLTKSDATRPGDAQVVMLIGNVYKRRGEWEQAIRYYERAASLDPRWHVPLINLAWVQLWLRRYEEAEQTSRRALSIEPRETLAYTILASVPLLRDGDIVAARRIVLEAAVSDGFKGMRLPFYLELLDHDYRAAFAQARGSEPAGWYWEDWFVTDHIRRAVALRLAGDSAPARVQFDSARVELVRELPGATQRRQAHNSLSSALAIAYAGLGRRSEAIALAGRVMTSDPVAFDALDGPTVLVNLALAYLFAGDKATALDLLERVMSIPSLPSPQLLRLDPLWDPLRGDPRFERLARTVRQGVSAAERQMGCFAPRGATKKKPRSESRCRA
jgi:serine/threonine-protein kinase